MNHPVFNQHQRIFPEKQIKNPNCNFALQPVLHENNLTFPSAPSPKELESEEFSSEHECSTKKPTLIIQSMLNDLVPDLTSTNDKANMLGSRLKQ